MIETQSKLELKFNNSRTANLYGLNQISVWTEIAVFIHLSTQIHEKIGNALVRIAGRRRFMKIRAGTFVSE
jgi:hypothetical protein